MTDTEQDLSIAHEAIELLLVLLDQEVIAEKYANLVAQGARPYLEFITQVDEGVIMALKSREHFRGENEPLH